MSKLIERLWGYKESIERLEDFERERARYAAFTCTHKLTYWISQPDFDLLYGRAWK